VRLQATRDDAHESDDDEEDDASSDVDDEEEVSGAHEHDLVLAIVLPLYSGGDLAGFVDAARGASEVHARGIIHQLVIATSVLHAAGFVHRDIKADNVLIRSLDAAGYARGTPHVVLCDFGLAVRIGTTGLSPAGTLEYIPPEALHNNYTASAAFDVWALGVLLFAIVAHRFPFDSVDGIRAGQFALSRRFSSGLGAFMRRLLQSDPAKRITMRDILNDPW